MKKGAYGIVYQDITRNTSLPLAAKGLYAYLASFCGASNECYPSVETILRETGVSRDTFYKYINILVEMGIVEKHQVNENGRFGKIIYKLTHKVVVSDLPYTDIPTTVKPTTKNPTTNNNNINSNNINNNNNKERYEQPEVANSLNSPKRNSRFIPPTAEEVREYCVEHNYSVDPQRFVDFYECKGWMVGKNKMKDWKAAVRTWVRRDQEGVKKDEPREKSHSIQLWE